MKTPPPPIEAVHATVYRVNGRRFLTRRAAENSRALRWMFTVRPCRCESGTWQDGYAPEVCSIHEHIGTPRHTARVSRVIRYLRRSDARIHRS